MDHHLTYRATNYALQDGFQSTDLLGEKGKFQQPPHQSLKIFYFSTLTLFCVLLCFSCFILNIQLFTLF